MSLSIAAERGDDLLERIVRLAEPTRHALRTVVEGLPRYYMRARGAAPQASGVYFIFRGDDLVYVGSAGHGTARNRTGLRRGVRRRLYIQFTRTRHSQLRRGIATELGHADYRPKTKAKKDPSLEARINGIMDGLKYTFIETTGGKSAHRLERLAIALLEPRFNRQ